MSRLASTQGHLRRLGIKRIDSVQQSFGKLASIESLQIIQLFAHTDEVNGNGFFAGNGAQHAPFGGAVQFGDDEPNLQQLEAAENAARRVLPMKSAVPESDWLGSRPTTPDSRPVIGEMPNSPGLWLAFGHQHIGFSTGPGTGVLLSELMSSEPTSIDPRPFAPNRY